MRDPLSRRHLLAGLSAVLASGCLELESGEETTGSPPTTGRGATTGRPTSTARPSTEEPTPTETAEPTAEPTPTATETPSVSYPLGVSEDGVSGALADTHHGVALETPFTLTYGIEPLPGPESPTARTHRYDPNGPTYEVVHEDEFARRHQVRRDGRTYARVVDAGAEDPVFFVSEGDVGERTLTLADRLKTVLEAGAFHPTDTHPTESPKTIDVAADGFDDASAVREGFFLDEVAALTGEGVVRESGLIQSLSASFDGTYGDTTERVAVDAALDAVGETTVTAPGWLETAREQSPAFELGAAEDYLTLTNQGGGPLPADAFLLAASADGTTARGSTVDPVPVGETLYVALPRSGNDLLTAVGDPPTGERATLTSQVRVTVSYREVGAFEGAVTP